MITHFDSLHDKKEQQKDYKEGLKGAFVRVTYAKGYVVGLIDDLEIANESYKVEQRETKTQIVLRNGEKTKQFKLNLISDQYVTEEEFKKCQRENRRLNIDKDYITLVKQKLEDSRKFQYDWAQMAKLVNK